MESGFTVSVLAGHLTFVLCYRALGGDGGMAVEVHGETGHPETIAKRTQLLRFDCFERDPHYHLDPDGKNTVLKLPPEADNLSWTAHSIQNNLPGLIRLAGFPETADRVNVEEVAGSMKQIRDAMMGLAASAIAT